MTRIAVTGERPYEVHVGPGTSEGVAQALAGAARTAIIHPAVLTDRARLLADAVPGALLVQVPAAERAKTADVLVDCWNQLAAAGFTRSDAVVGLGGGATTDLAGFVAATWLRGVAYVAMPTTVLGMVDAAVGGKTGINVPAGKNLVGAFHEPRAVFCDLDLLVGLPEADVRAGLAEAIKCGFISDTHILDLVDQDPADAATITSVRFAEVVRRAIAVKAAVVSSDLREATSSGARVGREALNYGHTLGHALEKADDFGWRHGEAVGVGMVFAAELSARTLGLRPEEVERHRDLLDRLGLPTRDHADRWHELRATMSLDKKTRGSRLRFVGLPQVGRVEIIEGPDEALLAECYASVAG